MKILDKVQKIFDSYNLKPIKLEDGYENIYQYRKKKPDELKKYDSEKDDGFFMEKYNSQIPMGWYGFAIGTPIIPEWVEIIDKILEICIINDPKFEIHQIKLKYGGMRFYVNSYVIEDINDVEILIMNRMFDEALIY